MTNWLLLIYKVPPEPTARRVYVWRKLKRLGAILLHDAAWVLPATDRTREQLLWLATEIVEMDGSATLWEARQLFMGRDGELVAQFQAQVDNEYRAILTALDQENPDLSALSRRYQQATLQDYFQSPTGAQVREALLHVRGGDTE
jgi:hypothetical protein